MKQLFLLLLVACSLTTAAQETQITITQTRPGTPGDTIKWPPVDTLYRIAIDTSHITGPTINLYNGYMTAKCMLSVKKCKNCPQYFVNCYRKEDGYQRTFWYDFECNARKIIFTKKLVYVNWYDRNW